MVTKLPASAKHLTAFRLFKDRLFYALFLSFLMLSQAKAQVLFVSDFGGDYDVNKITLSGSISVYASGFAHPSGVAVDSSGNLFVSNNNFSSFPGFIDKVAPTGTVSLFVSGLGKLSGGETFDSSGNLYMADGTNNLIDKINSAGTVTTFASGLNDPTNLAFDSSGNLYETDLGSNSIKKITTGGVVSIFATGLNDPFGLAFDSSGNLYVSNDGNGGNNIIKITPGGIQSVFSTGFQNLWGITFDNSGNLYAVDRGTSGNNGVIDEINSSGTVTPLVTGLATANSMSDITFTMEVTPEPSTWALMIFGSVFLLFVAWQQKRKAIRVTQEI